MESQNNTSGTELIPRTSIVLMENALKFLESIKLITITTEQENENVGEACKEVKRHFNTLEKDRKILVDPLNKKVTAINNHFKTVTSKLLHGEGQFKNAMGVYDQEKERKLIAEQKKKDAEAEEVRRKAAEIARKEAEKAEKYRDEGRDKMADEAEARAETAVEVATNTVSQEVEKKPVSGVSFTDNYMLEIEDLKKAILFCLDNPMFNPHVHLDIKALEKIAKATKGNLVIPGLKVIKTRKVSGVRS